jgi:ABC-2 type transport system ATP-binding protein
MMNYALEIKDLRKDYKGFSLKDVSFALPQGTIMGLVGPNGAGKTTVIKLILNVVRRRSGEIRAFGLDSIAHEKAIKARIGFVHETPAFVEDVPIKNIAAAVAPFYPKWDPKLFAALISEFGLPLHKKFKKLSHGMKMKFSLALALSHDADLLVLDEPTSGLDPVFRRELLERLSGLIQDERKSVLFSTHLTSDLERTADYITLINGGRVIFSLPKDDIRETWAVVKGGKEILDGTTRSLFKGVRETPHGVEALTSDIRAVQAAFPSGVVIDRASIEDIMIFYSQGVSRA